ncbi:hypothetical protein Golax_005440 [Gossypium laxum]|uniref:F-box domain-containing protein n=1 Tax=Gossypium laxum TaxID=34288 RepID=A0A7J9A1A5_9ROSI|nr:hypothetical protein [Gossypium laxum]
MVFKNHSVWRKVVMKDNGFVDWTSLPDDAMIQLFSLLNYHDRANLSATCKAWRIVGASKCLWTSLDLRGYKFNITMAVSLSPRCVNLQQVRFRGAESADAINHLNAMNLRDISGDSITDDTLTMLVSRHKDLRCIQVGPDDKVTSGSIKAIAFYCPKLKQLRLSGIKDGLADSINALANYCPNLVDIGFIDCLNVDGVALGHVLSVRFLSVAGTSNMKWDVVSHVWCKLPQLIGLDVSRTDISSTAVSMLLSSSRSLKVLCALNCPVLEQDITVNTVKTEGKLLLGLFSDIRNVFSDWGCSNEIMTWLKWILSHTLLRIAKSSPQNLDYFWLKQGVALFLSLLQCSQEDVQEMAASGLATCIFANEGNAIIDPGKAEAVVKNGGVPLLLDLAKSWQEGIQSAATKAISNLSADPNAAKTVSDEGGIGIFIELARSKNRQVSEAATGGLWNLSVGEEHKAAITEAGGIRTLVDIISEWSSDADGVLECSAGALANLAANKKYSMEIAIVGGVQSLATLINNCKFRGVQEQATRGLVNLAAHSVRNGPNAREAGALEALIQLTCSPHEGVRQVAAGALWHLSLTNVNREAIAAAGGVEALVTLAQSSLNASQCLQGMVAGALWGLSMSKANSIAIGREGGIPPLIVFAHSDSHDVHEVAAGALWNLAFDHSNVFQIVEEGGIPVLARLCSSSESRKASFMAALALAYICCGSGTNELAPTGTSSENTSKSVSLDEARTTALKHIEAFILTFSDPQAFAAAVVSSSRAALDQAIERAYILETGLLRCSEAEIGRFIAMLQSSSSILKAFAAFSLLQFTDPQGRNAVYHASLMLDAGAVKVLRAAAASASEPVKVKIFAKIVLRNLEYHQQETLYLV